MHRRRAPKTGLRRHRRGQPGGPPLTDTQQLYIRLVSEGMNNSGGMPGLWHQPEDRHALKQRALLSSTCAGRVRTYESITRPLHRPAISGKFLSERERLAIVDDLLAGEA